MYTSTSPAYQSKSSFLHGYISYKIEGILAKNQILDVFGRGKLRLAERELSRFEVVARRADCQLIRKIAKRLAEDEPKAERLRKISEAESVADFGGLVANTTQ